MVRIGPGRAGLGAAALIALAAVGGGHSIEARELALIPQGLLPLPAEVEENRPVVCSKGEFAFGAFSAPATAEQADDGAGAALRRVLAGDGGIPDPPQDRWRRLWATDGAVEFGHGDPPLLDGYVVVRTDVEGWVHERSASACIVRPFVADGVAASWKVDPAASATGASSTSLHVLVSDSQCAGGRSPEDRLAEPEVRVLADAVVISFTAKALEGPQTCPSHPPARRTIRLPERLGQRRLLDGATVPARPPCLRQGVYDCAP